MKNHFDVTVWVNNKHFNPSLVSRIRNVLVEAINKKTKLPKAVIVVLDNDLIRFTGHTEAGISSILKDLLQWMVKEINEVLTEHKEKLPKKLFKADYPKILWAESPLHTNFEDDHLRSKFNSVLMDVMVNSKGMGVLRLKKEWSNGNNKFFNQNRFTSAGLDAYWGSIDAAFKHWDTMVAVKNKPFHNLQEPRDAVKQRKQNENSYSSTEAQQEVQPYYHKFPHYYNRFKWNRWNDNRRFKKY